jgi:hypothetical protein
VSALLSTSRKFRGIELGASPRLTHPLGTLVRDSCGTYALALRPSLAAFALRPRRRLLLVDEGAPGAHKIVACKMITASAAQKIMRTADGAMPVQKETKEKKANGEENEAPAQCRGHFYVLLMTRLLEEAPCNAIKPNGVAQMR